MFVYGQKINCAHSSFIDIFILQAVFDIVRTLPVRLFASLIEWIHKYSKNAKVLNTEMQINISYY